MAHVDRQSKISGGISLSFILILMFAATLLFVNPIVRGDGVGYFSYLHSAVIDGDLQFKNEYLRLADPLLKENIKNHGGIDHPHHYTVTGHFKNQYSIGPALLWAPAYIVTHVVLKTLSAVGFKVDTTGYSKPYLYAVSLTTAMLGLAGLFICFLMCSRLYNSKTAFWAVVLMWLATNVPVYIYFQPSLSHAHSLFVVSLFLYLLFKFLKYEEINFKHMLLLGVCAGFAVTVYYINAVAVGIPLLFFMIKKRRMLKPLYISGLLLGGLTGLLPHFVVKKILYGSFFATGYEWEPWHFTSPVIFKVLFSSLHGLFSWTPVLLLSVAGWLFLAKKHRFMAVSSFIVFGVFTYIIASWDMWHGISSFGNRFFVSLIPFFSLGTAAFLDRYIDRYRRTLFAIAVVFILWNIGLMYQWGTGLIPKRTSVNFRKVAVNQIVAVPRSLWKDVGRYLLYRSKTVEELQKRDIHKVKEQRTKGRGRGYL